MEEINVNKRIAQQYVNFNLFKNLLFKFKVNRELKNCNYIEGSLLSNDCLIESHNRLNLIITDGISTKIDNGYFLCKGYTSNGSLTLLRKYTLINGQIKKQVGLIYKDIIVIDLYEKSIYLHNYSKHSCSKNQAYITGYLIKEEVTSKMNRNLIFTNEKVKINIKHINKYDYISVVDDFINKLII